MASEVRLPVRGFAAQLPGLDPRWLLGSFLRGNLSLAASHVLSLAASVVLARGLPADHFGILAFAAAVSTYAGLLSRWGTEISLVRDMADAEGGRSAVLLDTLALRARLAALALFSFAVPSWAAFSSLKSLIVTAMILGQIILLLDMAPLYDIEGRTARHVLLSTARQAVYTAFVLASVVGAPGDLKLLAIVASFMVTNVGFVARSWRDLRLPASLLRDAFSQRSCSRLARRNLPVFLSLLAHQCYVNLDLILISLLLGDDTLAPYAVASSLAQVGLGSTGLLHRLLQAPLAEAIRDGKAPFVYRRCLLVAAGGSLLVGAGLYAAAPVLIRSVYPPHMAEAEPLAQLLSVWILLGGFGGVASYALLGAGRDRLFLASGLAGAASNLVFNFALIPRYGVWGAAWATIISQALASGVALGSSADLLFRPLGFRHEATSQPGSGPRSQGNRDR